MIKKTGSCKVYQTRNSWMEAAQAAVNASVPNPFSPLCVYIDIDTYEDKYQRGRFSCPVVRGRCRCQKYPFFKYTYMVTTISAILRSSLFTLETPRCFKTKKIADMVCTVANHPFVYDSESITVINEIRSAKLDIAPFEIDWYTRPFNLRNCNSCVFW